MSEDNIRALNQGVAELRVEIRENTRLTQAGFEKINGRVRELELAQARLEGRESVLKPSSSSTDWKKVTFAILGILSTATTIALIVVQALL